MYAFGLGTYKLSGILCYNIVYNAIKMGYRMIDTALLYKNHIEIGNALHDSMRDFSIKREELFIISKIDLKSIKKELITESVDIILKELKLDYIDCILLHNPLTDSNSNKKNISNWIKLEEEVEKKRVKYIGVSNYSVKHLEELLLTARIIPYVNQIEISPFLKRKELVNYCKINNIKIMAHRSLLGGYYTDEKQIYKLLSWAVYNEYHPIPMTTNIEHLEENYKILKHAASGFRIELEFSIKKTGIKDKEDEEDEEDEEDKEIITMPHIMHD